MTKKEQYEDKTEKLVLPILKEQGFDLYDIEYVKEGGNYFLRVFIDKEGGITINDCELVSRRFSDLLDNHDYIADSYILEVSSPGLGRQLKKDKHLEKSLGEEVEIKLYQAVDKKKEFIGILSEYNKDKIVIHEDDKSIELNRENIAMVRLTIDF